MLFSGKDIAVLVQQRRDDLIRSLAADAVSTYESGKPGWFNVYLRPALELAASDGAQAAIFDGRGKVVTSTLATAGGPGPCRHRRCRASRVAGVAGWAGRFPADHPAGHPPDRVGPGDGPRGPAGQSR